MTAKPENVRVAQLEDEDAIYALLCQLYSENAIFRMEEEKVRNNIRRATRQDGGIIGLIEQDMKIVGSIGMFVSQYWYTQDWHLEEYWNFVHPDYRRSDNAKNLIDFAKWCNENMGLPLIIGIMSTHRTAAKMRLYEKRLKMIGALYTNGLSNAKGPLGMEALNG